VLRRLTVEPVTGASDTFQIDLPLASLAAGDYSVAITATSPQGAAKDVLSFRVIY
jgi:hypothetical protein